MAGALFVPMVLLCIFVPHLMWLWFLLWLWAAIASAL